MSSSLYIKLGNNTAHVQSQTTVRHVRDSDWRASTGMIKFPLFNTHRSKFKFKCSQITETQRLPTPSLGASGRQISCSDGRCCHTQRGIRGVDAEWDDERGDRQAGGRRGHRYG